MTTTPPLPVAKLAPSPSQRTRRLGAALAMAAVVVVWVLWRDSARRDPWVEGQRLSAYLPLLVRSPSSLGYAQASNAVVSLGAIGLPCLVDCAGASNPWHARWYLNSQASLPDWLRRPLFRWIDPHVHGNRSAGAIIGLGLLGTNAVPALRELMEVLVQDKNPNVLGLADVLANLGPGVLPYLGACLTDSRPDIREAAMIILVALGPAGAEVLPEFRSGLAGTDTGSRTLAVDVLHQLGEAGEAVLPDMRISSRAVERLVALEVMVIGNANARIAGEWLAAALDDPDADVRLQAALFAAGERPMQRASSSQALSGGLYGSPWIRRTTSSVTLPPDWSTASSNRWLAVMREGLTNGATDRRFSAAAALTYAGAADPVVVAALASLRSSNAVVSRFPSAYERVWMRARRQVEALPSSP